MKDILSYKILKFYFYIPGYNNNILTIITVYYIYTIYNIQYNYIKYYL